MATEKSDPSSFPYGSLLAIIVLVAGVVVHQLPLESKRPGGPGTKRLVTENIQDVDARLWQDPLAAAQRARDEESTKARGQEARDQQEGVTVKVIPVAEKAGGARLHVSTVRETGADRHSLKRVH